MAQAGGPDRAGRVPLEANGLLRGLSAPDRTLLWSHLSLVDLGREGILTTPSEEVKWAYFPCAGTMISLAVVLPGGEWADATLIGSEGVIGGLVSHRPRPAFGRSSVQIAGPAWRIPVDTLEAAEMQSVTLADSLARYADCLLAQVLQHLACRVLHNLEQRMARLLLTVSRHQREADLPLTHEALADMLSVARTYVTRTASSFQARGFISYGRGRIRLLDLAGLQALSCPCEAAVRHHFEQVLPGAYPAPAQGAPIGPNLPN